MPYIYKQDMQHILKYHEFSSLAWECQHMNCMNHAFNKANLRDFIAVTSLVILLKLDPNRWFFSPCDVEIWWMTLKIIEQLFYTKLTFFVPCDLEIWRMTLKNNRTPLLCYFKLCAAFLNHWWIEIGVTVWKCPIWVKIYKFCSRVTLQLDVWPWKPIGHLFFATSSFVHHFVAIGEFRLELQSKKS